MTVGRKLKRNVFIDTDIECQNCGDWQRVCTWNGECDNLEPMTNEEYLRSLNTEQLAEWFANNGFLTCPLRDCDDCEYYDKKNDDCDDVTDHKHMWVVWLKQPHTFE